MLKKLLLSSCAASTVLLAACGGGGTDSSVPSGTGPAPAVAVAGPLDPVQMALTNMILAPLAGALQGTPLAGVLQCADAAVVNDTLDVLDALLNGLKNPGGIGTTTAAEVQTQLLQLAQNLQGLLTSFSGGGCAGPTSGSGGTSGDPLAGTPLAPLSAALLPVLTQIQQQLGGTSSGPKGFASLAALANQLNLALQSGLSQVPASAKAAPIVGGVLTTLPATLADLSALLSAVANNDPTAFTVASQNTLDHLLVNVLTQIVPASYIETRAGKPGVITGPVQQAAAQLSAALASALASGSTPLVNVLNGTQLAPVLAPIENQLLPAIVNPITVALMGVPTGGSSGTGPTGTPLDALLMPLATALNGLIGSLTGGACVFANLPLLSTLCTVVP